MVKVDPRRCTYCGGCISVCPVEALTLEETCLSIGGDCIDCGDCVPACPVGALNLQESRYLEEGQAIRCSYDVVVVGAGPGGSMAAKVAAVNGHSVLLIEKRQEIGSPVRCAEGVAHDSLISFIEPDRRWIASEVDKAEITIVAGEASRISRGGGGKGYVLERRVYDRVLAERAGLAGAKVMVKAAAVGLMIDDGRIRGVKVRGELLGSRQEIDIQARIVIAADGVESQVGRWAGLDLHLPLEDTMVCAQYLLAGIDIDPTCTYYVIGDVAPGGYAWIFPKGERAANVGLGVQGDLWREIGVSGTSSELKPTCEACWASSPVSSNLIPASRGDLP